MGQVPASLRLRRTVRKWAIKRIDVVPRIKTVEHVLHSNGLKTLWQINHKLVQHRCTTPFDHSMKRNGRRTKRESDVVEYGFLREQNTAAIRSHRSSVVVLCRISTSSTSTTTGTDTLSDEYHLFSYPGIIQESQVLFVNGDVTASW